VGMTAAVAGLVPGIASGTVVRRTAGTVAGHGGYTGASASRR